MPSGEDHILKSSDKKKSSLNKKTITVIVILIAAIIIFILALSYYRKCVYIPLSNMRDKKIDVLISGSSYDIAETLEDKGLIRNKYAFLIYAKNKKVAGRLQAGKYEFDPGMNSVEIIEKMINGDVKKDTVRITIPEGYDIKSMADAFEKAGLVKKSDFLNAVKNGNYDYDFLKGIPNREYKLEGYLFPDTYEFVKGSTAEQIINKMLKRFGEVFNDDMRNKAKEKNMTIDDIVIIASMIEREAQVASERPTISAVIYNRLKDNEKLRIDATVLYALGDWKDKVTFKDLEVDSPYNTYKYKGLPIGPIANPGAASLEAALNPDNVNYKYYVAKKGGNGSHIFSVTYEEHLKAIENNK